MRTFKVLMLLACFSLLAACTGKPVKMYAGDTLSDDQVVMLAAGENIEVVSVDGKKVTKYLLSNIETSYALSPGKHTVVFNYTSVWAKAASNTDESRSTLVESKPYVLTFDAKPGARLRFEFDAVDNVRDAKVLAENFSAQVVDDSGKALAMSKIYVPKVESAEAKQLTAQGGTAALDNDLATIDAMKLLWERASADEKKQFLKWAFQ